MTAFIILGLLLIGIAFCLLLFVPSYVGFGVFLALGLFLLFIPLSGFLQGLHFRPRKKETPVVVPEKKQYRKKAIGSYDTETTHLFCDKNGEEHHLTEAQLKQIRYRLCALISFDDVTADDGQKQTLIRTVCRDKDDEYVVITERYHSDWRNAESFVYVDDEGKEVGRPAKIEADHLIGITEERFLEDRIDNGIRLESEEGLPLAVSDHSMYGMPEDLCSGIRFFPNGKSCLIREYKNDSVWYTYPYRPEGKSKIPDGITKIIHTALSMGLTIQSMHQEDLHDFGEYPSGKDFTPDELEEFLIPSMGLDYVRVLFDYQGHTIRVTESYWGFSVSADGSKKCVDIAERLVFEVTEE